MALVVTTGTSGAAQQMANLPSGPPGGKVDAEDPDQPDEGSSEEEDDNLVDEGERLGAALVSRVDDGELDHREDDNEDEGDEEGDDEAGHRRLWEEKVAAKKEGLLLYAVRPVGAAILTTATGSYHVGKLASVHVGGACTAPVNASSSA